MVYGTGLRLPGQFFNPSTKPIKESTFIEHLRETMEKLTPVPASDHSRQTCFVHPALKDATQVFIRKDWVKPPLTPPYDGPFQVLSRQVKHFTLKIGSRTATISIDRLKPAFSETAIPLNSSKFESQPQVFISSGRRVKFRIP
nr:uncharacterized protein LOC107441781 [Parasteatoda tepidariorum]